MTNQNLNTILLEYKSDKWFRGLETEGGWADLILELHDKMLDLDLNYKISQVKEKFGLLRFYFTTDKDNTIRKKMNDLAYEYKQKSSKICEYCGGEGKCASFGNWLKTSCESCLVEFAEANPRHKCVFLAERPVVHEVLKK